MLRLAPLRAQRAAKIYIGARREALGSGHRDRPERRERSRSFLRYIQGGRARDVLLSRAAAAAARETGSSLSPHAHARAQFTRSRYTSLYELSFYIRGISRAAQQQQHARKREDRASEKFSITRKGRKEAPFSFLCGEPRDAAAAAGVLWLRGSCTLCAFNVSRSILIYICCCCCILKDSFKEVGVER